MSEKKPTTVRDILKAEGLSPRSSLSGPWSRGALIEILEKYPERASDILSALGITQSDIDRWRADALPPAPKKLRRRVRVIGPFL